MIILATNVIRGKEPALSPYHFSILKKGACITSMTSLDDEAAQDSLIRRSIIKFAGNEGSNSAYYGPKGNLFYLMQNGRPANVGLSSGGAGESIYLVEAAGLVGAFIVAQGTSRRTLSDEDAEIISQLWLEHFHDTCH
jgi:hypothetical protein